MQRGLLCPLPLSSLACRPPVVPESGMPATRENLLAAIDLVPRLLKVPQPANLGSNLSIQGPIIRYSSPRTDDTTASSPSGGAGVARIPTPPRRHPYAQALACPDA